MLGVTTLVKTMVNERRVSVAAAAALMFSWLLPAPPRAPRPVAAPALVFDGVTVVDVEQGKLAADRRVVTVGNRITVVDRVGAGSIPPGAQLIDARGKYLIPGLWDMHAHVWGLPDIFYPLLIANGVTGIRAPGEPQVDSVLQWRQQIRGGQRVGPRMVATGPSLNGPDPFLPGGGSSPNLLVVSDSSDAVRVVDSLKTAGADFIKVRSFLTRDALFAILDEARRAGLPVIGHVQEQATVEESSEHGQRSLEHIKGIHDVCSAGNSSGSTTSFYTVMEGESLREEDSVDVSKCMALAERLARNGTAITPTLTEGWQEYMLPGEDTQYWPAPIRTGLPDCCPVTSGRSYDIMRLYGQVVMIMHHANVLILAGTDAASALPKVVPGFSLHTELGLLHNAGLTPLAALQAATLNPAQFLGALDSLGTVAPGKLADLVLLDGNPLADIQNTKAIRAVVADGRYYDRTALDNLLAAVKQGKRQP